MKKMVGSKNNMGALIICCCIAMKTSWSKQHIFIISQLMWGICIAMASLYLLLPAARKK